MKTALVTGGSGTIGGAIAGHLAAQGYCTMAPQRSVMDLLSPKAIKYIISNMDNIDVLVAAHGTIGHVGPAITSSYEEWNEAIRVNLLGTMSLIAEAAPRMSHGSHIVILAGGGGMLDAMPSLSSYACSKAALVSLVKTLSVELKNKGVSVNAIFPGMQVSKIHDRIIAAGELRAGAEFSKVKQLRALGKGAVPIEKTLAAIDDLMRRPGTGRIVFARGLKMRAAA